MPQFHLKVHETQQDEDIATNPNEPHLENKVKNSEADNLELCEELAILRKSVDKVHKTNLEVKIQKMYDEEKEKSKEKNIEEFREELLKVKKEKHKLSLKLKDQADECEVFNEKKKELKPCRRLL